MNKLNEFIKRYDGLLEKNPLIALGIFALFWALTFISGGTTAPSIWNIISGWIFVSLITFLIWYGLVFWMIPFVKRKKQQEAQ